MSVSLKHFVDVNIKQHSSAATVGTRKTVVLLCEEEGSYQSSTNFIVTSTDYKDKCNGMNIALQYLKVFFDNGGQSVHVYTSLKSFDTELIEGLPNEYICIAIAPSNGSSLTAIQSLASSMSAKDNFYGINKKIFVCRDVTPMSNASTYPSCVACKISEVIGAEMTIAAYLSKINVYDIDSVHDYMYTVENIQDSDFNDDEYEMIISKNLNVDIRLSNQVRNCGGNMVDGSDIVNTYVLIILHQTVTARLTDLLSQKIKSSDGMSKIYAVVSQELGNYLTCGYLTTDKVWTDPDLVISYNNENYTIVETGTALTDGYIVKVLPFSALTENDKALHKTPPIYIVLASQYGIRAITINGEVI